MPDTEQAMNTWTKLTLITERASREPRCQFISLAHLLNERYLADCYHALGRDRASGVDGVTWKEYGKELDENLPGLVARMKAKRYKPQPSRRVYIPKDEHTRRPLGILALEDKIVQKGMNKDTGGDIRGGFSGLLAWISTGPGMPHGVANGGQANHDEADQSCGRGRHQAVFRPGGASAADPVSATAHQGSELSAADLAVSESGILGSRADT